MNRASATSRSATNRVGDPSWLFRIRPRECRGGARLLCHQQGENRLQRGLVVRMMQADDKNPLRGYPCFYRSVHPLR